MRRDRAVRAKTIAHRQVIGALVPATRRRTSISTFGSIGVSARRGYGRVVREFNDLSARSRNGTAVPLPT